jgi:hypothetical protein
MKYNVLISGISQKISLGSVTNDQRKKIVGFSKETGISVSETIFNELTDVLNCEWQDICDIDIIDGAIPEESKITIYDEFDKIVFDRKLSELKTIIDFEEHEDNAIPDNMHLLAISKEKGSLSDEILYLDEKFDSSKLELVCDTFTLTDGTVYQCIQGFNYGDDFYVLNPLDVSYYQFLSKFI